MYTRTSHPYHVTHFDYTLHEFHFFFFNDTATTEIYTLSLHDALPILSAATCTNAPSARNAVFSAAKALNTDRKSTRLNSSHLGISYAVFCLKKKKNSEKTPNSVQKSAPISIKEEDEMCSE